MFMRLHALAVRTSAKTFSVLVSGAFASFGRGTILEPPIRLGGVERIALGSDIWIGGGSWLQVLEGIGEDVALSLGDGTSLAGGCVLSAAASVTVGRSVLLARNVYVSDHSHAFEDVTRPVIAQGITRVAAVEIADGAWLGENVVVCPGVRIGRGAVVGANSVVLDDVPDHAVAVGAPARVVRRLTGERAFSR
jgi:lipopolysaccharide O-acetyltransferase